MWPHTIPSEPAAGGNCFRVPIKLDGMVYAPTSDGITMGWGGIIHGRDGMGWYKSRVLMGWDGKCWFRVMGWDGNWWDGKCDRMGELIMPWRCGEKTGTHELWYTNLSTSVGPATVGPKQKQQPVESSNFMLVFIWFSLDLSKCRHQLPQPKFCWYQIHTLKPKSKTAKGKNKSKKQNT